ncbi:MAG: TIGR03905 family TSCPD domain-containing protein [Oscillospiraceae bacterium]|nr:TIGR03905 family TSCPD domain-containing protein [Oscillospiraceae bacterium]
MQFEYKPHGTCSTKIRFDIDDHRVRNVVYENGCSGNLQGVGRLVDGMEVDEVIARLKGIRCGYKDTSCPDQLAKALEQAKKQLGV